MGNLGLVGVLEERKSNSVGIVAGLQGLVCREAVMKGLVEAIELAKRLRLVVLAFDLAQPKREQPPQRTP